MKKVYLIRHGLPDFPGGVGMCVGTTDIPMGEKGLAQAAQMAKKLPPVTAVFSSPLTRAVQTAEAIGLPVTLIHDLREMYAGEWSSRYRMGIPIGSLPTHPRARRQSDRSHQQPDGTCRRGKRLCPPKPPQLVRG